MISGSARRSIARIVLIAAGLAAPAAAFAQDPAAGERAGPTISAVPPVPKAVQPGPPYVVRPDWVRLPTPKDLARAYPKAAREGQAHGRAALRCAVTAKGVLEGCSVESERPAGLGFGDAALRLSGLYRMKALTRDGAPVAGGQIVVVLDFAPPGVR